MFTMYMVRHAHVIELNRVKFKSLQLGGLDVTLHDMCSWMTFLI
jgi:hypothetical protein